MNYKIFPLVKILTNLPNQISLYETVLITINDYLVDLFLRKKIKYYQIHNFLLKFIKKRVFIKYKKIKPKKIEDIMFVKNNVSSIIIKELT